MESNEWYDDGGALNIKSGLELSSFDLGTVSINRATYTVLTGYEGTGKCFWCGGELKGKLKRYCRGHMKEYYRHFEWASASAWAKERVDNCCENCGQHESDIPAVGYSRSVQRTGLEVHHIVPLNGGTRYFSAFNLPWNLIALCHDCHKDLHRVMSPPKTKPLKLDSFEYAEAVGQGIFALT